MTRRCTTHHACDCIQAKVERLEAALRVASDDLYKAANQFQGLMPDGENWRIFEEKARRADLARRNDSVFPSSPGADSIDGEGNTP